MEKNYTKVKFHSREEWLKQGRKLGGSSAGAILGVSKWKRPIDIRYDFKCETREITKPTPSQEYGNRCEDLIRQIVKLNLKEEGIKVIDPTGYEMYFDKTHPYLTATLDGHLIVENESLNKRNLSGKGVLEIKTGEIKSKEDEEMWSGRLPQEYLSQVLHYLMVMSDYSFALLVAKLRHYEFDKNNNWMFKGEDIRYYRIYRKDFETTINRLKIAEIAFYEEYINGNKIPAF